MDCNYVFQDSQELHWLEVQNKLLKEYESPVINRILSGKEEAYVLDVGCNDGYKTAALFSDYENVMVIGLEYLEDMAAKAQNTYGNGRFSFYRCNVEQEHFTKELEEMMEKKEMKAFDVIYLSFVLMHLKNPENLLLKLKDFLSEDGRLIIVEPFDHSSSLVPDREHLLDKFLEILSSDPLAGNRSLGLGLKELLYDCGYCDLRIETDSITCDCKDIKKKQYVFETFFSYLPQDIDILCNQEPENLAYKEWKSWINTHYSKLEQLIMRMDTSISMGTLIVSCKGGSK